MKTQNYNYFGTSKYWWLLLVAGVLLMIGGFTYWFWPVAGFAVASLIFGWLLVVTGAVQLCVSAERNRPRGWGWWLTGGIINVFIGFLLVSNIFLAEAVLPYFLSFVFFYSGLLLFTRAFGSHTKNGRWLYIVNGILLIVISGFFVLGGYMQEASMVSFLAALAFVYWGFIVSAFACDLRPRRDEQE